MGRAYEKQVVVYIYFRPYLVGDQELAGSMSCCRRVGCLHPAHVCGWVFANGLHASKPYKEDHCPELCRSACVPRS